jgi:sporulation protein YlmC with PRC-barrel domain
VIKTASAAFPISTSSARRPRSARGAPNAPVSIQHLAGAASVADQDRRIAGPARSGIDADRPAGDGLREVDNLPDRIALRIRQIAGATRVTVEKIFESAHVRVGNVHDVDVVADAGAVRRIVVGPEHIDGAAVAGRCEGERNEVRLRIMGLADLAVRVGACGVEVAQRHRAQARRTVEVAQHPLDHQLGEAVRIDGRLRMVLPDRQAERQAIRGAGR